MEEDVFPLHCLCSRRCALGDAVSRATLGGREGAGEGSGQGCEPLRRTTWAAMDQQRGRCSSSLSGADTAVLEES